MGNIFSVSISGDQPVDRFCNFLFGKANYIHKLDKNLEALRNSVQELKELRSDVMRKVKAAEGRQLKRLDSVQGWLSRAETLESQADGLLDASSQEIERLCVCGYCSKNFISSSRYGETVFKKWREVETMKSKGDFEVVVERVPTPKADERPIQPTVGLEFVLEGAWNRLMEYGVGVLGLYGMGGVGKTTLLTQINNKFCAELNEFDNVIWVVVSKNLEIERIQADIWKKLGLYEEEWEQKGQDEKAIDIFNVLRRRKFVLLLDDIWKKVTLTDIGVPSPSRENGSKVVFTTRSREVCGHMRADAEMEVECLAPAVAWDLFQKKVGENTLNSHPDIPRLARKVAKKCRGLPLALKVIGEAMTCKKTIQEWRYAIHVLNSSASEFSGMQNEILPVLKFSYDNLKEEKVKSCFVYCALFPENYAIRKDWLIHYWLGDGIMDGKIDRDGDENEGYEIIGTLIRACLLVEDETEDSVKMHDVVRQMALWIASDFGKQKDNIIVQTGAHLREIPKVKDWKTVRRMSLVNNHIENISCSPNCPKLLTLFLQNNNLASISGEFFLFMPMLVVLDLSHNVNLTELPEEISKLVSLLYLFLNCTGIERLPVGLKELRKLIYLDLDDTWKLQSIAGISSLRNLQILRLCRSGFPSDFSILEELRLLERLKLLAITLQNASVLERFLSLHRLATCTQELYLKEFTSASDGIPPATLDGLCYFGIENSDVSEIKIDWGSKGSELILPLHDLASPSTPCFQDLSSVLIKDCKGFRDLTWLLFAPSLAYLVVKRSFQVEELINREKAIGITDGQPDVMPFQKLKLLHLSGLDELRSIYWKPLPFPSLRRIFIKNCPKLRKLPLDSESAKGHSLDIHADKEWAEGLEWEDEATKERFFPS